MKADWSLTRMIAWLAKILILVFLLGFIPKVLADDTSAVQLETPELGWLETLSSLMNLSKGLLRNMIALVARMTNMIRVSGDAIGWLLYAIDFLILKLLNLSIWLQMGHADALTLTELKRLMNAADYANRCVDQEDRWAEPVRAVQTRCGDVVYRVNAWRYSFQDTLNFRAWEHQVRATEYADSIRAQQYTYLYGIGFHNSRPFSIQQGRAGEAVALAHRVFEAAKNHVEVPDGIVTEVVSNTFNNWDFEIPSLESWLERFPLSKRKRLGTAFWRRKEVDYRRSAFTKRELITALGDRMKPPRLISAVSDEANLLLGPWMLGVNELLKNNWNLYNRITYASGLTAEEAGLWMEITEDLFESPHFYVNDFMNFDGTISVGLLKNEVAFYALLPDYDVVASTLRAQFYTTGFSSFGLRYEVAGTRKSGDPNTSVGNSLINGSVHAYWLDRHGVNYRMIVLGDDMVLATDTPIDELALSRWIKSLGLMAKFSLVSRERVDFCSRYFWRMTPKTILGPKVGRFCNRCGWSKSFQESWKNWFGANLYGLQGTMDLPILRQLRDAYACDAEAEQHEDVYRFLPKQLSTYNDETEHQFQSIYRVSGVDVFLSELPNRLPAFVDSEWPRWLLDSE